MLRRIGGAGWRRIPVISTTSWRRTVYALWVAQMLTLMGFGMRSPFLPFYLAHLGASSFSQQALWAGIINAGGAATMAVGSPIWGVLSDRYGRKPMVLRAMFAGWITITLMALATSPWHLLGLRLVEGALTGTSAAATALIATTVPKEKLGFSLGLVQTGIFSGAAIGPLAGGILADLIGYRATFVIAGSMLFLGGALVLVVVREDFQRPVRTRPAPGEKPSNSARALLFGKVMLAMVGILVMVRAASSATQPIIPLFVEHLGARPSAAATLSGLALGIVGLTSAISSVILGRLADRIGHRPILIVSALLAGLFFLPQAAAQSVTQLVLVSALFGIAAGGILPTANALIAELTPVERRGAVFGYAAAVTSAGGFVGPLGGSALAAWVSIRATFLVIGALLLGCGLWVWSALRQRQVTAPDHPAQSEANEVLVTTGERDE